ncbi:MAG TPA: response regulator [bacterium]|nr:response regulator [bacterium]
MAKIHVLLIEDDPDICELVTEMLQHAGQFRVDYTGRGEQALKIVESSPPDIVLMDIGLEGNIDGIEAAEAISARRDIPIIYLTGSGDQATIDRAKHTSPYGYLIKPIDATELRVAIEIALNKYRYEQELDAQRQLLATTLSSIYDGVITTDKNGIITYFNESAEHITGYASSEVLGRQIQSVLPAVSDQHRQSDGTNSRLTQNPREHSPESNITLTTRSRKEIPIELTVSPIITGNDKPTGNVFALRDITAKKEAARRMQAYQDKLRSLATALSILEETQRREFATELHERIGQKLAMGKMKLNTLLHLDSGRQQEEALEEICELIDQSIEGIRTITREMAPSALYDLGLDAALQWLLNKISAEYPLATHLNTQPGEVHLPKDIKITLFHAIRELVVNAARHAGASELNVSLGYEKDRIHVEVSDDGVGMNVDQVMAGIDTDENLGLFHVRERIEHLQGDFEIKSVPDQGTQVVLTVPLNKDNLDKLI